MNDKVFKEFCWFIKEREKIRCLKDAGAPPPWTDDPILQKYKFCNVWRQDDRTTRAIQERIQGLTFNSAVMNIFLLRLINNPMEIARVELVRYGAAQDWKETELRYSDAFIILPALPKGTKKIDEIKRLLLALELRLTNWDGKEVKELLTFPRIKGLILYEMMLDFWQWRGMEEQYVNIGNGALPTLKLLFPGEKITEQHIRILLEETEKATGLRSQKWGELTLRCIEGAACEFRKFTNLRFNPKAKKRYYVHSSHSD